MAPSTQDVVVLDMVERQGIINNACSKFIEIGFLSEMFTLRKIHENGYTDNDFLELIKPLYFMGDWEELTRLTASTPKNDFGKFVELMVWLQTEEGIQSISDAYTRTSKKNVIMTKEGVALAHKLIGYAATRRLTRQNIIDEINELTRCLREREKKSSDIDDDLKMNLGPLYAYKEPSLHELRIEAYKLYEDDCKAKRIPAFPIDHKKGFEIATQKFGAVAKDLHLRSYLNDPIRKERIEKHFKERSFRFEYGDEEEGGGGRDEIFELAADSGKANKALATKIVHKFTSDVFSKPQPPAVNSLSSSETDEAVIETPENLVKPASDVSKVQSPDSKTAQTDSSQSKRKRAHTDMSEGVSIEPQDSEREPSEKKPATEDSEKPTPSPKKNKT